MSSFCFTCVRMTKKSDRYWRLSGRGWLGNTGLWSSLSAAVSTDSINHLNFSKTKQSSCKICTDMNTLRVSNKFNFATPCYSEISVFNSCYLSNTYAIIREIPYVPRIDRYIQFTLKPSVRSLFFLLTQSAAQRLVSLNRDEELHPLLLAYMENGKYVRSTTPYCFLTFLIFCERFVLFDHQGAEKLKKKKQCPSNTTLRYWVNQVISVRIRTEQQVNPWMGPGCPDSDHWLACPLLAMSQKVCNS